MSGFVQRADFTGMPALTASHLMRGEPGSLELESLSAQWLRFARAVNSSPQTVSVRRSLDIVLGFMLALFTLPLMLLTMLAIVLDSHGPVLYRQERVGLGGRSFTVLKFRSMIVDAEASTGPAWATKGDRRVTRVGKFIRLTRIDELPQLINVLRGDMSLVGPRPERPHFVDQLAETIPHYKDRHVIKPGLTGWAQVNYSYGASVEDARAKLAFDLYYIRHRTFLLDLWILASTVRVVLFRVGAR